LLNLHIGKYKKRKYQNKSDRFKQKEHYRKG